MKRISMALALSLAMVFALPASAEEDTRVFQWSANDKANPKEGIGGEWDLTQLQLGLTVDDELEFFALTKIGVAEAQFEFAGYIELLIDTNLDKNADYVIGSAGEFDANYMKPRTLKRFGTGEEVDCEAYGWVTPDADAVAWQIPKSCLDLRSEVNVAVQSTADGIVFDRLPDGAGWQKFKTQYMKAAVCSSKESNKKVTYQEKTWVCMKSGRSWVWRDYAPIAAKSAKYLTERAFYLCRLNGKFGVSLEDKGKTLTLSGAFKYFITEADYNCVKRAMAMPSSVDRRISITRAIDGLQEAKWGRISAFWNYHPDDGLDITFSYN